MFRGIPMFENLLAERLRGLKHLLIVGVGNELGCDDAAGVQLARTVKREFSRSKRMSAVEAGTTPENFTSIIRRFRPSHVLIVDAAKMGMPPGSLRILERNEITGFDFSTHSLPLSILIDYLEKSSRATVIVVGIEPLNVGFGKKLSKPVLGSIADLVKILKQVMVVTS